MRTAEQFEPVALLRTLVEAGVDFVVIGGVAGGAHGSSYPTYDLDVACARDAQNLERLTSVLRSLDARIRGAPPNVPFRLDARSLQAGSNFTFETARGPLDILARAEGAPPYERLKAAATAIDLGGHVVLVASLDHLIAMKEAAGRTKDKLMAAEYRVLADAVRRSRGG